MENKNHHLSYFISGGLTLSFILSVIGSLYPVQSFTQTAFFKADALFAISAFACLAAKASGERFDVPAAGFSILAIAQGLFLTEINEVNKWDIATSSLGVLFMIPAFILISYYTLFPKWLRIAGIISIIPFLILLIIRMYTMKENSVVLENIVFLIYQMVTLCWAWEIWKLSELKKSRH
ncbi:MAG: hypothetical protein IPM38_01260 [Ignavibacteria bacterium]|nr:hypothetical protein [Ignavibacteria bacterium]